MEKERKIKTISAIALIVAVLGLTVAFAVLSARLTINGTAKVDPGKWDIYFENLSSVKTKGKATEESAPQINDDNKTEINNINITLTQPKDEVEYTVEIVNDGTIDTMISSVNKQGITKENEKYISFIVTYDDGSELGINDLIKAKQREKLKIIIKYNDDVEELPNEDLSVSLSFSIAYVQADDRANESHTGTPTTSKKVKTYQKGEDVSLGTEHFYVLKDNGDSLTLLSKYNLLVGYYYSKENDLVLIEKTTDGYGLQNEKAIGGLPEAGQSTVTIAFADQSDTSYGYWADESGNLKNDYGSSYPVYVYDSNSNIYKEVEEYKKRLGSLGYPVSDARLMKVEEAEELGCTPSNMSCSDAPDWLYATTYWLGSAYDNAAMWRVANLYGSGMIATGRFYTNNVIGVRPVVEIDKERLEQ